MRETFHNDLILRLQRRHYTRFILLPMLASLAAVPCLWWLGVEALDWTLFIVMFVLTMAGIELGAHRYLSHQAFKAHPAIESLLVIFASMGAQGQVLHWACTHRHHHKYSDDPGDPHTPHHRGGRWAGFLRAHILWMANYPLGNPDYFIPDLLKNSRLRRVAGRYEAWIALGLLTPAVIGGLLTLSWRGFIVNLLLAGLIRISLTQHSMFLTNSVCHMFGTRPYRSSDRSGNLFWVVPFNLGSGWHNIHHAFPYTAKNQLRWWQWDPGYWILWTLKGLGLVWDVNTVSPEAERRKLSSG